MQCGDTQAHADGRGPVKLRGAGTGIGHLTFFTQKLLSSGAGGKTLALKFHLKTQGKRKQIWDSPAPHMNIAA